MDLKTIRTILLMLLLVAVSIASFCFYQNELYFCLFFAVVLGIIIISSICQAQYTASRMMLRMIQNIRYGDFSLNYSTKGKSHVEKEVVENINEVMAQLRTRMSDMEERYQYYETLLDTVDSCLLVADKQGKVMWMNHSGVQELCGHAVHLLEELNVLNKDFSDILETLSPGEVKVVRIYKDDLMQDMAVTVTEYSTQTDSLRLINLRNIRSVLEENDNYKITSAYINLLDTYNIQLTGNYKKQRIVIQSSAAAISENVSVANSFLIVLGFFALIIAAVFAYIISKRITDPIHRLSVIAKVCRKWIFPKNTKETKEMK